MNSEQDVEFCGHITDNSLKQETSKSKQTESYLLNITQLLSTNEVSWGIL